ncbi:hypothetical protein [Mycolicibacter arupensis]|jgi:hypothetical protein|uniref:Uncharacterized protein n=1 Tax=Mycolicibacter arupensis TaxID=342002 RepID=A0A0F5MV00_9MYCO|nr:hypothetical protein [Mycolicibacter arupensis]KAA1431071.1 hypothetical protein F0402_10975 [Mycolicibacter arupensis]KKB98590.1 hypothetical protein WR43_13710 [Mycolicibacter arupensis]MCV7277248.1 hypothetical protein [Mycolicibacter arupensis]OQZ98136.1 hypothetical protein BST15_09305 [Mycolicibacter arupensis]TXI58545.1 MAG: hypothetical protein E6Q54_05340 [Mycolicibacter arupensis]
MVLAVPACADPASGRYHVTGQGLQDDFYWELSSCGPDCLTIAPSGQLHRAGNGWAGTTVGGCKTTLAEPSLTGTYQCPMLPPIDIALVSAG